jgi:hypothetical protein
MARKSKFSPEVRERAIGLVRETRPSHDSEWAAITSVAEKMGCTPENTAHGNAAVATRAERDAGLGCHSSRHGSSRLASGN